MLYLWFAVLHSKYTFYMVTFGVFMEYQYRLDSSTGTAQALFSLEHQVFGQWLESEISNDQEALINVLKAIDDIAHHKEQEVIVAGREYTLTIDQQDVRINMNAQINNNTMISEIYADQDLAFDENGEAMCGLEDFRELILSWSNFIKK